MRQYTSPNARLIDRVCYLSKSPSKDTDLYGNEIEVKHTFPYNPDSKTAPDTAERWANHSVWNQKTRTYENVPKQIAVERDNTPFNVWVIDLDVRSEGGRAYKVIDEDNNCFDLREDQVLEVFKHSGILKGGGIPGTFVWGILGSQMRMVLVGGDLHKKMVEQAASLKDHQRKQAAGLTPTEGTLQFGHIYRKRDKSLHVFVGRVKTSPEAKTLFAFVQLPTPPHDFGDDMDFGDDSHGAHMRAEREVARAWETMSWEERCKWAWYDTNFWTYTQYRDGVPEGYYDHPGDIVLLTSPKFEAEVTDMGDATELAKKLFDNAESKHKYVNGKGDDLAEAEFVLSNNNHPREWPSQYGGTSWYSNGQYVRITEEERKAQFIVKYKLVTAEYIANRAAFQFGMMWQS